MRIALTHNLRQQLTDGEIVFTPPETVQQLTESIIRLGHVAEPVEVTRPPAEIIDCLAKLKPDLVFNIAEGVAGEWRQSFPPALFEEMGLPYTGSGPRALAVALDKHLTKLLVKDLGVATPDWRFVRGPQELSTAGIPFPAIVKPNFEACSRGITQQSVVSDPTQARAVVGELVARYPAGVIVEEFIAGRDITVAFLEAVENDLRGILEPAEIVVTAAGDVHDRHGILDYDLKNRAGAVDENLTASLQIPAALDNGMRARTRRAAEAAVRAVGCRDLARVDFRLGRGCIPYLLEVNSFPSVDSTSTLPKAAALAGLDPTDGLVAAVISSAARRYGLAGEPLGARAGRHR